MERTLFLPCSSPTPLQLSGIGRQMVAAQQVANILDRHRILHMIWALSSWNEVVFTRNTGGGAGTFVVSPNQFVVGQGAGGMGNLSQAKSQMNSLAPSSGVDLSYAYQLSQPLGGSALGSSSYPPPMTSDQLAAGDEQVVDPSNYSLFS